MYDDLRRAVQKLHDRLQHPQKKEAVGYVLDLFAIQDQNPNALQPKAEALKSRKPASNRRRQAFTMDAKAPGGVFRKPLKN